MKYLIKITDKRNTWGCVIDSEKQDYEALWLFLWKFYSKKLSAQQSGNHDEYEKVLMDVIFGKTLIMFGDITANSVIGEITIEEYKGEEIPLKFEGKNIAAWIANKMEAMEEEVRNHQLNVEMAQQYANPTVNPYQTEEEFNKDMAIMKRY